jgi:(1->4)-alpha-D-glucan 1-alpha-D-glucosylmutase
VVREAKEQSSWLSPDPDYESALSDFIDSSLENSQENGFLADFLAFSQKVAYYGALNSLAQVLLKVASPGIPDFYQGTELWDFSLVDPDNRRPVDFEKRRRLLDNLIQQEGQGGRALVCQLLNSWQDGRVKLYLTYKALNIRSACREVFRDGRYIPLQVAGQKREHVVAFSRHKEGTWVIVVIPRLLTRLVDAGTFPLGEKVWGSDQLILPDGMPEKWLNSLTGENLQVSVQERGLLLSDILNMFPVALLVGH